MSPRDRCAVLRLPKRQRASLAARSGANPPARNAHVRNGLGGPEGRQTYPRKTQGSLAEDCDFLGMSNQTKPGSASTASGWRSSTRTTRSPGRAASTRAPVPPGPSVESRLTPSLAAGRVSCCHRGFGCIDDSDRRLDCFGKYLCGGVSAAGHELPGNQSNKFSG